MVDSGGWGVAEIEGDVAIGRLTDIDDALVHQATAIDIGMIESGGRYGEVGERVVEHGTFPVYIRIGGMAQGSVLVVIAHEIVVGRNRHKTEMGGIGIDLIALELIPVVVDMGDEQTVSQQIFWRFSSR